ncbi:MAG: glycoside hydrolase family 5 protein, partial [Ignavibacteria bacterium]
MKKICIIILLLFNVALTYSQNNKFIKWQDPAFFRGYNVLYESPKTLQDFIDFRNYGGNLFHIGTDGFMDEDPPYSIIQENIEGTDLLVSFCKRAGIYYAIAVRSGPGAYDTYDESQGWTGESRIWNTGNFTEQQLYASMLRMIIERYNQDTLFVGLNLVVEPRPKFRFIPANNSNLYKWFLENIFNIHMDQVYQFFINEIRADNPELPIILENFAFSTPELFPAYIINDPYIIYSSHNYQPKEYTNAAVPYSRTYPGFYWNITYLSQQYYDANFMRQTVFSRLRSFEIAARAPIFLGEFGMLYPQNGGPVYLRDVLDICLDYGWHFGLWDWRRGSGQQWNIENFQGDQNLHWKTVLSKFHAPPVPALL